jgi:hypothetical protein
VFIRAFNCSLSWAISILSTPSHPISIRSILILPAHLRLGVPSGHFPSGFPNNILYTFPFSPIRATCHAHITCTKEIRNVYTILVGKPKAERSVVRLCRRWDNDIEVGRREIGCEITQWIHLAQDMAQ